MLKQVQWCQRRFRPFSVRRKNAMWPGAMRARKVATRGRMAPRCRQHRKIYAGKTKRTSRQWKTAARTASAEPNRPNWRPKRNRRSNRLILRQVVQPLYDALPRKRRGWVRFPPLPRPCFLPLNLPLLLPNGPRKSDRGRERGKARNRRPRRRTRRRNASRTASSGRERRASRTASSGRERSASRTA